MLDKEKKKKIRRENLGVKKSEKKVLLIFFNVKLNE